MTSLPTCLTDLNPDTEKESPNWGYPSMTKTEEETIVKQHERLIRNAASSFVRLGVSMDDLMQEGRLALVLAARNWKSDRGASIWTYARRFVLGAMFATVGQQINAPLHNGDGDTEEVVDPALSADERLVLLELLDRLSPRELQVVRNLFLGETLEEVAGDLDLSITHTHRIREGAVTKMREAA